MLLSQAAWESVKPTITQHPGAAQVISLGTHVISDDYPNSCLLMEVSEGRLISFVCSKRQLRTCSGMRNAALQRWLRR